MPRATAVFKFDKARSFFDRKTVIDALSAAERKVLSKFGAFVRTNARRNQLRRAKRSALPGEPPKIHSKDKIATLRRIFFAYESSRQSVIIGPDKLNQRPFLGGDAQTVPELMEQGGMVRVNEITLPLSSIVVQGRIRRGDPEEHAQKMAFGARLPRWARTFPVRRVVKKYPPHPFMRPALKEELPKLPGMWRNSVKRQAA